MNKILITGCAGFIGFHLTHKLLKDNNSIIGLDNMNNYYSSKLKKDRLSILKKYKNFFFIKNDLSNLNNIINIIKKNKIKIIVHLAAQAGVRLSVKDPEKYFTSNIVGFYNILESSRLTKIKKLIFASSSSVYGDKENVKTSEKNSTNPIQFYATTKVCNEEMAKVYSIIYKMKIIGLRFFTVYGPWGRPDMAYYSFGVKLLKNKSLDIFNNGQHKRDFTFIDDVIKALHLIIKKKVRNKKSDYEIYNIANSQSNKLFKLVSELEKNLNVVAKINYKKKQIGDVKNTFGNSDKFYKDYGFKPNTSIESGLKLFCDWLKIYIKK